MKPDAQVRGRAREVLDRHGPELELHLLKMSTVVDFVTHNEEVMGSNLSLALDYALISFYP